MEMNDEQRIAQLEEQIASFKARLPKHSTPAGMLLQLEEWEDELKALKRQIGGDNTSGQDVRPTHFTV
jgi:predicted oxidoreductase (fatty acid repression mutant protein)